MTIPTTQRFPHGSTVYDTYLESSHSREGTSFRSWTFTVKQSNSVSGTAVGGYFQWGSQFSVRYGKFTVSGVGTAANEIVLSRAWGTGSPRIIGGWVSLWDASASLWYHALPQAVYNAGTKLIPCNNSVTTGLGAAVFTAGLGGGDVIHATLWEYNY